MTLLVWAIPESPPKEENAPSRIIFCAGEYIADVRRKEEPVVISSSKAAIPVIRSEVKDNAALPSRENKIIYPPTNASVCRASIIAAFSALLHGMRGEVRQEDAVFPEAGMGQGDAPFHRGVRILALEKADIYKMINNIYR